MLERTLKLILPVFIAASLGFTACDKKEEKKDDKKADKKGDDKEVKADGEEKKEEKADGGW